MNARRLNPSVTSCVGVAFCNTLLKERWKTGEDKEEDVSSYGITLRQMGISWNLEEKSVDRTVWRTFGRGYGPVVRGTT